MPAISHTRVWLILLAITAATYWIGEAGLSGHGSMGPVLAMFALAFVKGVLVCLDFLELRHAPALWRWLVVGWLALVLNGAWNHPMPSLRSATLAKRRVRNPGIRYMPCCLAWESPHRRSII